MAPLKTTNIYTQVSFPTDHARSASLTCRQFWQGYQGQSACRIAFSCFARCWKKSEQSRLTTLTCVSLGTVAAISGGGGGGVCVCVCVFALRDAGLSMCVLVRMRSFPFSGWCD